MARTSIKCCHCDIKVEVLEYRDAISSGWSHIGWRVETGDPLMMCSTCHTKWLTDRSNRIKLPKMASPKEEEEPVETPPVEETPKKKRGRPKKVK